MNETRSDRSALLRLSLRANAAFSGASGAVCVAAGTQLASFLGVQPALLVPLVGLNLLAFAAGLVWLARQPALPRRVTGLVIALDLAWVGITAILVYANAFTRDGATLALVVADVVFVFAVLQAVGLRRMRAAGAPVQT